MLTKFDDSIKIFPKLLLKHWYLFSLPTLVITSVILSIRAYLKNMLKALGSVSSRFFRKNVGMTVDIFYMYAKETTLIPVLTFRNCLESMASDYFSCLGLSDQKGGLAFTYLFLGCNHRFFLGEAESVCPPWLR